MFFTLIWFPPQCKEQQRNEEEEKQNKMRTFFHEKFIQVKWFHSILHSVANKENKTNTNWFVVKLPFSISLNFPKENLSRIFAARNIEIQTSVFYDKRTAEIQKCVVDDRPLQEKKGSSTWNESLTKSQTNAICLGGESEEKKNHNFSLTWE